MERNSTIAAPASGNVTASASRWGGSTSAFYRFITTPSMERDRFVAASRPEVKAIGSVSVQVIDPIPEATGPLIGPGHTGEIGEEIETPQI